MPDENTSVRPPPINAETYIGDGVYASHDGYQIWLRAPQLHGDQRIALEPLVLASLLRFAASLGWRAPTP